MSVRTHKYGSLNVPTSDDHFDERNMRYLDHSPFEWGRFFRAFMPILIALFIMGGFAYGMFHGFGHIHGPPRNDNTQAGEAGIPQSQDSSTDSSHQVIHKQCSQNTKCAQLDLLGDCCPTVEGLMLDCCDLIQPLNNQIGYYEKENMNT